MAVSKRNVRLNLGNTEVASNQNGHTYLQTHNSMWKPCTQALVQSLKHLITSSCVHGTERSPPVFLAAPGGFPVPPCSGGRHCQPCSTTILAFTGQSWKHSTTVRAAWRGNTGALMHAHIPLNTDARLNSRLDNCRLKISVQQLRTIPFACLNSLRATFVFNFLGSRHWILRQIDFFLNLLYFF